MWSSPVAAAALGLCCATVLACASGAQPGNMVPRGLHFTEPSRCAVNLRTRGGEETFPLGRSHIANEDFDSALVRALEESNLMTVSEVEVGKCQLEVEILELDRPHWAFPMTVRLVTRWRLEHRREVAWEDVVETVHTVPFSEEFFGIRRLRLANEGAARENIREGLLRMRPHLD